MILLGAIACAASVWLAAVAILAPSAPRTPWPHPESDRLRDAGWRWTAVRWEATRLCCGCATASVAWGVGFVPATALALGLIAPSFALRVRSDARRERAGHKSLDQLRAVRAALASGASLAEAIRRGVASVTDAIASRPLRRVVREFSVGASLSDSLRGAASEAQPRLRPALRTLAIGVEERLPVPQVCLLVGAVIERLSFDEQLEAEVRARTSGVQLQIWGMAAIVPALAFYLAATVPIVGEALRSDLGTRLLIPTAAALELLGIALARQAARDVTV